MCIKKVVIFYSLSVVAKRWIQLITISAMPLDSNKVAVVTEFKEKWENLTLSPSNYFDINSLDILLQYDNFCNVTKSVIRPYVFIINDLGINITEVPNITLQIVKHGFQFQTAAKNTYFLFRIQQPAFMIIDYWPHIELWIE